MTLRGELRLQEFAGPVFILRAADGGSFELRGDIPLSLLGRTVRVEGREAEDQFGFAMVGPVIDVLKIERG